MKIGIIGAGNLGGSIAKMLVKNGYKKSIMISDNKNLEIFNEFQRYSNQEIIDKSDVLFLCVKPNDVKELLKNFHFNSLDKLLISCVAGISIKYLEEKLNERYPIIRCMANIPISLGKGSITFIKNNFVIDDLIGEFYNICNGPTMIQVEKENLIDVSTILTGSMPAFSSFISKEIIDFGVRNGLKYEDSRDLYISTIIGTMEMLKTNSPEDIIKAVSSPNGVTKTGLYYLEESRSILFTTLENSLNTISSLKNKN